MPEGHPHFKSIDVHVQDPRVLFDLYSQHSNRRRYQSTNCCPPWETQEWGDGKLVNFDVDLNMIDRIYHVRLPEVQEDHHVYGRMDYKGRSLYFHIHFAFSHRFLYWRIRPESYLTFDPEVFLKAVIDRDCNPEEIWKAMLDDGLAVDEPTMFDFLEKREWSKLGIPSLKFLSHMAVHENRRRLGYYIDFLPSCVARSIKQFIKVRETHDDRYERPFDSQPGIPLPYSLYP